MYRRIWTILVNYLAGFHVAYVYFVLVAVVISTYRSFLQHSVQAKLTAAVTHAFWPPLAWVIVVSSFWIPVSLFGIFPKPRSNFLHSSNTPLIPPTCHPENLSWNATQRPAWHTPQPKRRRLASPPKPFSSNSNIRSRPSSQLWSLWRHFFIEKKTIYMHDETNMNYGRHPNYVHIALNHWCWEASFGLWRRLEKEFYIHHGRTPRGTHVGIYTRTHPLTKSRFVGAFSELG